MSKPVIGVLLHGCGAKDGSEIHEAVFTMVTLEMAGAEIRCIAPRGPQHHVSDHSTETAMTPPRDMFVEAARIARGNLVDLAEVKPGDLDGIVIPGGFGTAYNICNFAEKGLEMEVHSDVSRLLLGLNEMQRPIGAVCIAPIILAKVFGPRKPRLTLGEACDASEAAKKMGAEHVVATPAECVVDSRLKLVTTPAYMTAECISQVFPGIQKLAVEMVQLAAKKN